MHEAYRVGPSKRQELLDREALLLKSLLQLLCREVLCGEPGCCVRSLCIYSTYSIIQQVYRAVQ